MPHYIPQALKTHLLRASGILRMSNPALERSDERIVAEVARLYKQRPATNREVTFLRDAQVTAVSESAQRQERGMARMRMLESGESTPAGADAGEEVADGRLRQRPSCHRRRRGPFD